VAERLSAQVFARTHRRKWHLDCEGCGIGGNLESEELSVLAGEKAEEAAARLKAGAVVVA
jgi:phage terminase large subunit GpA-like protein